MRRHVPEMGLGDFDEIAEDAIVLHLEGGNSGRLALSGFELDQELRPILAEGDQAIELRVRPEMEDSSVARNEGSLLPLRGQDARGKRGERLASLGQS